MSEVKVGKVTHYFDRLGVAVFEVTDGESRSATRSTSSVTSTDFTQPIESMQVEHQPTPSASAGQSVGIKTQSPARQHDNVFRSWRNKQQDASCGRRSRYSN